MDKVVVTGGAGFIGSNLARGLLEKGYRVTVFDSFATGKRENLAGIEGDLEIVEGDIRDKEVLDRTFADARFVFHQAALPSVPRSIADPISSNEVNIGGTLNVLVAARDAGVQRVVYAASSSAYGNADAEYKTEDLPARPLSPYALTKYVGEVYAQQFTKLFGLETVSLRYFNVFGPYQDPNSQYSAVIPKFITLMLKGESPVINGDGTISRDFTYVANNVEANILAATAPGAAGEVCNIACGDSISLNELVDMINEILGTEIRPQHKEMRAGDIQHSKAGIQKARKLLGYEPKISFKEGLRMTIEWYKERAR